MNNNMKYIGYFCSKDDKTIISMNFDSSENLSNKNKILSRILDHTIISIEDFDGNELPLDEITKNKYYDANNQINIYLDKNNLYMDNLYEVRPDLYKKYSGCIRKYCDNGILRSEYFLSNGVLEGDFILYNSEREIIAKINYVNGNIHGNVYAVIYDWFVKNRNQWFGLRKPIFIKSFTFST